MQGSSQLSKTLHKPTVVASKPQKGMQLSGRSGYRPICYQLDFRGISGYSLVRDGMVQVMHLQLVKAVLSQLGFKDVLKPLPTSQGVTVQRMKIQQCHLNTVEGIGIAGHQICSASSVGMCSRHCIGRKACDSTQKVQKVYKRQLLTVTGT